MTATIFGKNKLSLKHIIFALSFLFFIAMKFYIIHNMWENRQMPPEPDDSFSYISSFSTIDKYHFTLTLGKKAFNEINILNLPAYFSYSVILYLPYKIFSLDPVFLYHISFFIGTILMAIAIFFFSRIFSKDLYFSSACFFILAFFNGAGSIHGFFWVVPSFFSVVLLFFLWYLIEFKIKYDSFLIVLLSIIFSLVHPLAPYSFLILVFYYAFEHTSHFFKKKSFIIKNKTFKLGLAFLVILFCVFFFKGYFYHIFSEAQLKSSTLSYVINDVNSHVFHPYALKYTKIELIDYFFNIHNYDKSIRYLARSIIFLFSVLIAFLYRKKIGLFYLYISSLFFLFLSLFVRYGHRSVLYVLIFSFVLIAYLLYYLIKSFRARLKENGKMRYFWLSLYIVILLFLAIFLKFSFLEMNHFSHYVNNRYNLSFNSSCYGYFDSAIASNKSHYIDKAMNLPGILKLRQGPLELSQFDGQEVVFCYLKSCYSKLNLSKRNYTLAQNCSDFGIFLRNSTITK